MEDQLAAVVTTIAPPTESVRLLARRLAEIDAQLLVVGDRKGPADYALDPPPRFLPLADQRRSGLRLARVLPENHYARKNIGYLEALRSGATCIYETDDDNAPIAGWTPRQLQVEAELLAPRPWVNVLRLFCDEPIWPRGFPLDAAHDPAAWQRDDSAPATKITAPIQQGLVTGNPDTDAIWRLVVRRQVRFQERAAAAIPAGSWAPCNSQSTWWWRSAFPLLYLPSCCSFRMTDIWRGFVAQRCLWASGQGLVFHPPEVHQQRNPHDLMADFAAEVPGYVGNRRLCELLAGLPLAEATDERAVVDNLRRCYEALVAHDFLPERELELVAAWIEDLRALG